MKKLYFYLIVTIICLLIFSPLFSSPPDEFDFFCLRPTYTIGVGDLIISTGSDVVFTGIDSFSSRSSFLGVTAGFTPKFNLSLSVSTVILDRPDGVSDLISNDYPFAGAGKDHGMGYFTIGGKYILKKLKKSLLFVNVYTDIPLSGRSRGVTTTKARLGVNLSYNTEIFPQTFLLGFGGFKKNIDPEDIDLADELNYGIGIRQYINKSFFLFSRFSGSVYSKTVSNGFKGYIFSVLGAGYGSGSGFGISLAYKKIINSGGERRSGSGIIGSIFYFPGKRAPRCVKLNFLSIKGMTNCKVGTESEYFSKFSPDSASGPINYEWNCSGNGDIVRGKWSPGIVVEWISAEKNSFVELIISNGCSELTKRFDVNISEKENSDK